MEDDDDAVIELGGQPTDLASMREDWLLRSVTAEINGTEVHDFKGWPQDVLAYHIQQRFKEWRWLPHQPITKEKPNAKKRHNRR